MRPTGGSGRQETLPVPFDQPDPGLTRAATSIELGRAIEVLDAAGAVAPSAALQQFDAPR